MGLIQILEKVEWREYLCLDGFGKSAEKMFSDAIKRTNRKGISYFVNDKSVSVEAFEQVENKFSIYSNSDDRERTEIVRNGYLPPTVYEEKRTVKRMYITWNIK